MAADYDRRTGRWSPSEERSLAPPVRRRADPFGRGTRDEDDGASSLGLGDELDEREVKRKRMIVGGSAVAALGAILFVGSWLIGGGGGGTDVNELLSRGVLLQNSGRLDEAADVYREVIDADPDNKVAFFNLGVIDHTQGETQEAAANYVQVLSLDPAYVPALFNLAILRSEEGDSQGAIGLYRRVITVEPDNAGALLNLGILLLTTGEEQEATEMIQRAVELNPSLQQSDGSVVPTTSPTTAPTTAPTSGQTIAPAQSG